ncbi:MAG: hypothetical protein IJM50_05155 [Lachnospiraceae bacterium]|nr:hypothetical protein [Lachnospiraceae bacterium]
MKKRNGIVLLLCALLAVFMMTGCKSEAVKNAESLIEAIGTVDLDSEGRIKAAEAVVAALSEKDLKHLDGADKVEKARADYNELVDNKKITEVEDIISSIGKVTLDSEKAIEKAKNAYDKLEDRLKEKVSNRDLIAKAEDEYLNAQAAVIEDAIRAIGKVTLDSQKAIDKAKQVYESYPEEVQKRVSNYDDIRKTENSLASLQSQERVAKVQEMIDKIGPGASLEDEELILAAEKAMEALSTTEKQRLRNREWISNAKHDLKTLKAQVLTYAQNALSTEFKHDYDAFQNTDFYYPKGWSWYGEYWAADQRCFILPYIGVKNNRVYLRTVYNYTADDWIFWTKVTVVAGGE